MTLRLSNSLVAAQDPFGVRAFKGARGSVTAELAMALPSVALVIAITLGGFGLQVERMKLVSVAASAARALGRGEAEVEVQTLVSSMEPNARLFVEHGEFLICAKVTRKLTLVAKQEFEVGERQCARKMGL